MAFQAMRKMAPALLALSGVGWYAAQKSVTTTESLAPLSPANISPTTITSESTDFAHLNTSTAMPTNFAHLTTSTTMPTQVGGSSVWVEIESKSSSPPNTAFKKQNLPGRNTWLSIAVSMMIMLLPAIHDVPALQALLTVAIVLVLIREVLKNTRVQRVKRALSNSVSLCKNIFQLLLRMQSDFARQSDEIRLLRAMLEDRTLSISEMERASVDTERCYKSKLSRQQRQISQDAVAARNAAAEIKQVKDEKDAAFSMLRQEIDPYGHYSQVSSIKMVVMSVARDIFSKEKSLEAALEAERENRLDTISDSKKAIYLYKKRERCRLQDVHNLRQEQGRMSEEWATLEKVRDKVFSMEKRLEAQTKDATARTASLIQLQNTSKREIRVARETQAEAIKQVTDLKTAHKTELDGVRAELESTKGRLEIIAAKSRENYSQRLRQFEENMQRGWAIRKAEGAVEQSETQIRHLQNEVAQTKSTVAKLQKALKAQKKIPSQEKILREQLQNHNSEQAAQIQRLSMRLVRSQTRLRCKTVSGKIARDDAKAKGHQLSVSRNAFVDLNETLAGKVRSAEGRASALSTECSRLTSENNSISRQLKQRTEPTPVPAPDAGLLQKTSRLETENGDLRGKVKDAEGRAEGLEKEKTALEEQLRGVETAEREKKGQMSGLERKKATLEERLKAVQEEKAKVEADHASALAEKERDVGARLEEARRSGRQDALKAFDDDANNAMEITSSTEHDLSNVQDDLAAEQAKTVRLEHEVSQLKQDNSRDRQELNETLQSLQHDLSGERGSRILAEANVQTLNSTIQLQMTNLAEMQSLLDNLSADIHQKDTALAARASEVQAVAADLGRARGLLEELCELGIPPEVDSVFTALIIVEHKFETLKAAVHKPKEDDEVVNWDIVLEDFNQALIDVAAINQVEQDTYEVEVGLEYPLIMWRRPQLIQQARMANQRIGTLCELIINWQLQPAERTEAIGAWLLQPRLDGEIGFPLTSNQSDPHEPYDPNHPCTSSQDPAPNQTYDSDDSSTTSEYPDPSRLFDPHHPGSSSQYPDPSYASEFPSEAWTPIPGRKTRLPRTRKRAAAGGGYSISSRAQSSVGGSALSGPSNATARVLPESLLDPVLRDSNVGPSNQAPASAGGTSGTQNRPKNPFSSNGAADASMSNTNQAEPGAAGPSQSSQT